jgi:Nuclease-related domain
VRQGWTVLHDVAIPGSRANGDHLLIGPPGVFLVDSKAWHGHITQAIDGSAWHKGYPLDQVIATVRWEAEQVAGALGAPVLALLCVHDTRIPWDEIYVDNVPVLTRARLLALLRSLPAHMDQVGVMLLAEHTRHQLPPCYLSQASSQGHVPSDGGAPGTSPPATSLFGLPVIDPVTAKRDDSFSRRGIGQFPSSRQGGRREAFSSDQTPRHRDGRPGHGCDGGGCASRRRTDSSDGQ